MKWVLGTDVRGRLVRCPLCDKPVGTNQHVRLIDGVVWHKSCADTTQTPPSAPLIPGERVGP